MNLLMYAIFYALCGARISKEMKESEEELYVSIYIYKYINIKKIIQKTK